MLNFFLFVIFIFGLISLLKIKKNKTVLLNFFISLIAGILTVILNYNINYINIKVLNKFVFWFCVYNVFLNNFFIIVFAKLKLELKIWAYIIIFFISMLCGVFIFSIALENNTQNNYSERLARKSNVYEIGRKNFIKQQKGYKEIDKNYNGNKRIYVEYEGKDIRKANWISKEGPCYLKKTIFFLFFIWFFIIFEVLNLIIIFIVLMA